MDRPPTPEELAALADALMEEMRRQGVAGSIAYDQENQRLINEFTGDISVAAFAVAYCVAKDEDERSDRLMRYVRANLAGRQPIETWDEARTRVLPLIRPEIEYVCRPLRERLTRQPAIQIPTGPVTEHLRVHFVWEIQDATSMVLAEDVHRWGVTLDELQDVAAANLLARTPTPLQWLTSPNSPGVFRSKWKDSFDATRVLLSGLPGQLFATPAIALATSNSTLFLADSSDDAALFQLGLAAQRDVRANHDMVWMWPVMLDGGAPRHWLPDEGSSAFAPLSLCASIHAEAVYNQHRELLQRVLDLDDVPVKVSPVGIVQTPWGAAGTMSVWSDARTVALAPANAVMFRQGDQTLGMANWQDVERVLGTMLEEMPGYPKRYRTAGFPEPWQLAQLDLQQQ